MGPVMASTIPDLWPDDITVDVVPPLAILRSQAGLLGVKTKGILRAEVTTTTGDTGYVQHHLDIVVPALQNYRARLLNATHDRDRVYPVAVEAECFMPRDKDWRPSWMKADETAHGGFYRDASGRAVAAEGRPRQEQSMADIYPEDWRPKAST